MNETKKKISDFLARHQEINLSTVSANGNPYAAVVAYVNSDNFLYFSSEKSSQKALNILSNPNAAFTSAVEMTNWTDIKSIQMQGTAVLLNEKEDIDLAMGMLMKKFPQMTDMRPIPNLEFFKLTFTEGYFLDYSVQFMHREKVTY